MEIKDKLESVLQFILTHVHSVYSLLDGTNSIKDLLNYCIERELPGICISDHGNLLHVAEAAMEFKKAGKKIVHGVELYMKGLDGNTDKAYHLCLYAMDKEGVGMRNINKLISESWRPENVYRKNLVTYEMLRKYSKGIIATTACLASEYDQLLLKAQDAKNIDEFEKFESQAHKVLEELIDIYPGRLYLEIQNHGIEEEDKIRPVIIRDSKKYNVPLIAGTDAHYTKKDDAFAHEVTLCVSTASNIQDPNHMKFNGTNYHLLSGEEMEDLFGEYPEAIANTVELFERCEYEVEFGHWHLPKCPIPDEFRSLKANEGKSEEELIEAYFMHLCYEGFRKRFAGPVVNLSADIEVYKERMRYETEIIKQMGFCSYFVILWDAINFAMEHDIIIGPGRGSAAGSLVAYCLSITQLDPIEHGLLFERFLNPERVSMPDIDTDIQYDKRDLLIQYVAQKYGYDNTALIATFGINKARSATRDSFRAMGYPASEGDRVSKMIPKDDLKMTIKKALEVSPDLKKLYDTDSNVKEVLDVAMRLEGKPRQTSTHAAGIVIADAPISDYVATMAAKNRSKDGISVIDNAIQASMQYIEDLGFLKYDFLGLKGLTVIAEALKLINADRKKKGLKLLTNDDLAIYNPYVYQYIGKGQSYGVFQLESQGMMGLMKDLFRDTKQEIAAIEEKYPHIPAADVMSPFWDGEKDFANFDEFSKEMRALGKKCFENIVIGISMYRPGPMGHIPRLIENMRNPESIVYDCPQLEPILGVTYGCMVYQEQVMRIVRDLAGYTYGRSDLVRRLMSKKKMEAMKEEKEYFINGKESKDGVVEIKGCIANGVSEAAAEKIYDDMAKFAEYAFNKSHAACYAFLGAQMGYLKNYYPLEFICATLSEVMDKADDLQHYLQSFKGEGFEVLPPHINKSETRFVPEDGKIRFGLKGIKNVGAPAEGIIRERNKNGEFASLRDFVERMSKSDDSSSLNAKVLESMILSGGLDDFEGTRSGKLEVIDEILKLKGAFIKNMNQISLFDMFDSLKSFCDIQVPDFAEFDPLIKLKKEREFAGIYISGHPLDSFELEQLAYSKVRVSDVLTQLLEATEAGDEDLRIPVKAVVLVSELEKKFITKKDSKMSHFYKMKVEDQFGQMNAVCFTGEKTRGHELFDEKGFEFAFIEGTASINDFGPQIVIDSVSRLSDLSLNDKVQDVVCYITEKSMQFDLKDLAAKCPGDSYVYVSYQGKMKQFPNISLDLTNIRSFYGLQDILGQGNYDIVNRINNRKIS